MIRRALNRVISKPGFGIQLGCSIWLGSEAISETERKSLTSEGVKVTRFLYPVVNADRDRIMGCLELFGNTIPARLSGFKTIERRTSLENS